MKKIAKILIVAMLLSVFATACGSTEPEVFDVDFVKEAGSIDLEGIGIIYKIYIPSTIDPNNVCLGYEIDTVFADLASKRLNDVQQNMNCTVDIVYDTGSVWAYQAAVIPGTFVSDVVMGVSDVWTDAARLGMMVGLSELEDYIDFRNEAKWGYRNMLEVVYYEDDLYGVIPLLWPEIAITFESPIVVNENIISQIGATDPRDYIENGEWTWDKFKEVLELYYLEEGGEVKHYALTCGSGAFAAMFVRSNGDLYAEKDINGKYVPGFISATAVKAMEAAIDIFNGSTAHTIDSKSDAVDSLISGNTVMGAMNGDKIVTIGSRITREMDNFGILSWPIGPDVEPGYNFATHSNIEMCIAFSRVSKNPEATAAIINAIYEPFDGYETLDDIIDHMARSYFFDRRDAVVFYDMFRASEYNYFHYGLHSSTMDWLSSNKSISEYIEANEEKITEGINEYVMPSVRGIDALWGEE